LPGESFGRSHLGIDNENFIVLDFAKHKKSAVLQRRKGREGGPAKSAPTKAGRFRTLQHLTGADRTISDLVAKVVELGVNAIEPEHPQPQQSLVTL
jgi:hypothetical protein